MRGLRALSIVAATACSASLHGGGDASPTLEVHNASSAAVRLRVVYGVTAAGDTLGMPLGTVFAGRAACFRLESRPGPQVVKVYSFEGDFVTPTFISVSRPAWRLDLSGHATTDRLSLEPADAQCRP
jgi:hypothetical protein